MRAKFHETEQHAAAVGIGLGHIESVGIETIGLRVRGP